ncbi:MAG TPA: peptidylprolyl isomerase [Casimicrobiaceae bacterium]|nr:peptidylprolyl isomerase [Casimicrobiaceae bacterium]
MTMLRRLPAAALVLLAVPLAALAQPATPPGVRPLPPALRPAQAAAPASNAPLALDRVVAVVNDEALTQFEMNEQKRILMQQLRESRLQPPAPDVLDKQVLDRLITERALLQYAKETGIRVDDTTVERTILRIAQENKLTPDEFRKVLDREGIAYGKYIEDVRRELVIQRLRDREIDSKIFVSDAEVDNYLATVAAQAGGETEYLVSHILVRVPEQSSPEQIAQRLARANEALAKVRAGEDFAQVAATWSDANDAQQGGNLGWRTPARLPSIFVEAVRSLKKGEVSEPLRSPAGFHIVKVVDERSRNAPNVVQQTRVRHILVKVNELTSDVEAKAKIDRIRERIETGAKFEDQARVNSEDASSAKGGELGWITPGDVVPDFQRAMENLKIGELSAPVRSPFGWHLLQVMERREQDVSKERQRDQARLALRQRKADEQFADFVRQTRDRAYVEIKADER